MTEWSYWYIWIERYKVKTQQSFWVLTLYFETGSVGTCFDPKVHLPNGEFKGDVIGDPKGEPKAVLNGDPIGEPNKAVFWGDANLSVNPERLLQVLIVSPLFL